MLPNHSSFAGFDEEHFLVGARIHAALEKMPSPYLKKEFRSNARRFFDEFCSTILSTVAARSKLGQGVNCFCPELILGGDDHYAFFVNGQLLVGLSNVVGRREPLLKLAKPSFNLLYGSSASWSVVPQGSALM